MEKISAEPQSWMWEACASQLYYALAVAFLRVGDNSAALKALEAAAGAWKDKDHPELKRGAARWVKKLRREYDQRLAKVPSR
jgi:hypothetical protein